MSILASFVNRSSLSLVHNFEKTSSFIGAVACRNASKKTGGSSRNHRGRGVPKHRGVKVQDGAVATAGSILVLQRGLRFHPGLNVGFGKNGTLFAIEEGRVMITCEKIEPDMDHTWIQRIYAGRDLSNVYKKFVNIITEPQHNRFKLVELI